MPDALVERQGHTMVITMNRPKRYNALTGRHISLASLDYWEIVGNLKWAIGALTQARRHLSGQQRSVELAVLGRLAAEMEFELLHLLERAA